MKKQTNKETPYALSPFLIYVRNFGQKHNLRPKENFVLGRQKSKILPF